MIRPRLFAFVACFALALAPTVRAFQEEGGESKTEKKADDKPKDEKKKPDRWFAVTNGDVYSGHDGVLRGATVLSKNGKIDSIGYDLVLPPDTKVLDAKGYRVYPGLVAIASQGLLGNSASDFEDTIDPFNQRMVLGLATGITTTGSGSGAVKLKRFTVDDVVLADKLFATFSWSDRAPRNKRELRDKFRATADYLRQYRQWEKDVKEKKDLPEPSKKGVDNSCLSVLKGEQTAKFVSQDRDELLGIAQLAQEFGFRPLIEGAQEGWTVADELGRAGARVILTPRDRHTKDEQQAREGGTSIENAAKLYRAGVQIAIVPRIEGVDLGGIVGRDIIHLPIEVDFAVRGGLPEQAAIDSMTIVPARMMGISHRVGSLEVGKDCDLIVTDGDILHYATFVQWAVVDGRQVYDKEKELFYAGIRPRPPVAAVPRKLDKGETETTPKEGDTKEGEKTDDEKKNTDKKDEDKGDKKDGDKKGGDKESDDTPKSGNPPQDSGGN